MLYWLYRGSEWFLVSKWISLMHWYYVIMKENSVWTKGSKIYEKLGRNWRLELCVWCSWINVFNWLGQTYWNRRRGRPIVFLSPILTWKSNKLEKNKQARLLFIIFRLATDWNVAAETKCFSEYTQNAYHDGEKQIVIHTFSIWTITYNFYGQVHYGPS